MAKYAVNYDGVKSLYNFSKTISNSSFAIYSEYARLLSMLVVTDKINEIQKKNIILNLEIIADNCLNIKNVSNKVDEVASAYLEIVKNDLQVSYDKPYAVKKHIEFAQKGAMTITSDEELKRKYALKWVKRRKEIRNAAKELGKSEEEIIRLLQKEELKLRAEFGFDKD